MSTKRILFVDDEPNVLDGLRNLLRRQRKQWDMVFASGGQEALDELHKAPFDVVVTDMRMPGMDGAALLRRVKDEYPAVARIVLSGHAEAEAAMRVLPVAHQFLSKPCNGDALREVIERTCELQALLNDQPIQSLVGQLDRLPSAPRTYGELSRAVEDPNVGVAEIARIVENDPAMCVKVLQLANSGYFGSGHPVVSARQAVTSLGVELLKMLALAAHVFAAMDCGDCTVELCLDRLQQHSIATARIAGRLLTDPKLSQAAFAAGIVHDVGYIVLALARPDQCQRVRSEVSKTGRPAHVVEQEIFGTTHAEVGAYVLGVWGLPFSIVEAVAHHHRPERLSRSSLDLAVAVHLADLLANGVDPEAALLEDLGVSAQLPAWREMAIREAGALLIEVGDRGPAADGCPLPGTA